VGGKNLLFLSMHQDFPSFDAYLWAKEGIDSKSLHQPTWQLLVEACRTQEPARVLEVGAGVGTMLRRLFLAGALGNTSYWALEPQLALLEQASRLLEQLVRDYPESAHNVVLYPLADDWQSFSARPAAHPYILVVAHAFVDLVDAPAFLDSLVPFVAEGSLVYLSLIFDGLTQWYPQLPEDDELMDLYHADMGHSVFNGTRSGPRSARLIWNHALKGGWKLLSAGPSDWIMIAPTSAHEQVVQLWLLSTIHKVLGDRATSWVQRRLIQARQGNLGLRISHMDLLLQRT